VGSGLISPTAIKSVRYRAEKILVVNNAHYATQILIGADKQNRGVSKISN